MGGRDVRRHFDFRGGGVREHVSSGLAKRLSCASRAGARQLDGRRRKHGPGGQTRHYCTRTNGLWPRSDVRHQVMHGAGETDGCMRLTRSARQGAGMVGGMSTQVLYSGSAPGGAVE